MGLISKVIILRTEDPFEIHERSLHDHKLVVLTGFYTKTISGSYSPGKKYGSSFVNGLFLSLLDNDFVLMSNGFPHPPNFTQTL